MPQELLRNVSYSAMRISTLGALSERGSLPAGRQFLMGVFVQALRGPVSAVAITP